MIPFRDRLNYAISVATTMRFSRTITRMTNKFYVIDCGEVYYRHIMKRTYGYSPYRGRERSFDIGRKDEFP